MPIVLSKDEWDRLNNWNNFDAEDPEVVKRREYVKYLDKASREMTKSWPNSLENVNKRNEELRQARILLAEQTNTKFYKRYLKREKEKQERLMYSARDMVFKNKDAPKLLLSAVIETTVQKERDEQVKFLNERRKEEAILKRQEDDGIISRAKEWYEHLAGQKKRRFEANKQHQRDILEQAHEVAERKRMEYETEINLQKIDNMKADEQMEALKKFDEEFNAAEKARIFRDMELAKKETAARKREQAERDKMDDKLIEVLLKSRCRIEKRRRKTEADVKEEKRRLLEKISMGLECGDNARDAKEEAILKKALKEKMEQDDARIEARRRKDEEFRQVKKECREKFLRDQEQRLHEFNTTRQWELMNRFKNNEIYADYQEQLRQKKARQIAEYRKEILRLWKEREDREAKELADTRYFYGELAEKKLRDADNKLLTHANALLQEAKNHGRPDFALHRAIDAYCRLYRLYPMPELPDSLQKHFPDYKTWDGSRPDEGYVEAPPPYQKCSKATSAPEDNQEPSKRDGLQSDAKPGPSMPKVEKKEEKADYKRTAPANGLQRKNEQACSLPPISVRPCTTETCRCELKK